MESFETISLHLFFICFLLVLIGHFSYFNLNWSAYVEYYNRIEIK